MVQLIQVALVALLQLGEARLQLAARLLGVPLDGLSRVACLPGGRQLGLVGGGV